TWLSPVEYAGKFKAMHGIQNGHKSIFIHIGPFMSLTAANADKFLNVKPGNEVTVALGIIHNLLKTNSYDHLPKDFIEELKAVVSAYEPKMVEKSSGLSQEEQHNLFQKLIAARSPLVLGSASPTEASLALDMSVTLINLLLDRDLSLYAFDSRHAIEKAATIKEVVALLKDAAEGQTDLFILYNTNPLFALPSNTYLEDILGNKDIFKVSFSSFMDETTARADLVFPVRLSLETWDAYASKSDLVSTLQPVMGRLTKAPPIGDVFIKLSKQHQNFDNYQHFLMDYLYPGTDKQTTEPWLKMIQLGGNFDDTGSADKKGFTLNPGSIANLKTALTFKKPVETNELQFMAVPSIRLYDGRGANKAWLNEIPDPITNIAWESMLFIHPETLGKKGLKQGDILSLEVGKKSLSAPVYSYQGVHRDLIVMQTGLGHKKYGRYAAGFGSNPFDLFDSQSVGDTGSIFYLTTLSALKKTGSIKHLPKTDGSRSQYKRKIAVSLMIGHEVDGHAQKEGLTMDTFPLTLPIKEGYDKKRDVYPAHEHVDYRWGMAVDLDRCIGCSACVAACYAENNIGVVGREEVINGREMAWLRIERYEDQSDSERLIFLPMMCQHCDNAPCESVCPVYAPYHSVEGLNNQIYNRCIGTRFCAQNCPYKVRRFNWYDWKWPKPLNLQLNPNVTVRSKGVMEKCSFCVQRIKQAHSDAKDENRMIGDGDIQPACVQTCPTNALVFGNFLDKKSTLYTQAKDPRAYQVLGYLNTKPAVIYLKKVVQKI
ncbi:MAG: 4Fe-4S dicluster domain-containing protein, partial [SAR324 cluster bacterium]|nr:4Fe-4S dicluster domain-containing protein [SAR324 cluster bacterium]